MSVQHVLYVRRLHIVCTDVVPCLAYTPNCSRLESLKLRSSYTSGRRASSKYYCRGILYKTLMLRRHYKFVFFFVFFFFGTGCGLTSLELGYSLGTACTCFILYRMLQKVLVIHDMELPIWQVTFFHKDPMAIPHTWDHVWSHIKLTMTFSGHYTVVHEKQLLILFPMV
jgi:hypothetical protein